MGAEASSDMDAGFARWREDRLAELAGPDSCLGWSGLFWLEAGGNAVGAAADCAVRLPAGPDRLGELQVDGTEVRWHPLPGCGMSVVDAAREAADGGIVLRTDAQGAPSSLVLGSQVLFVIERGGRLAVRLRDRDWARAKPFAGLDCHPHDPAWRLTARLEALPAPLAVDIPTVGGELKTVEVAQRAVFRIDGEEYFLLPMEVREESVFFAFRDVLGGRVNYGGGRFLRAARADDRVDLDFNRAYNPPCAFTPFATCPLPPAENWLPFPVPAGEKKYAGY